MLANLGGSLAHRFELLGDLGDLDKAVLDLEDAARSRTGPARIRFDAAAQWVWAVTSTVGVYRALFGACVDSTSLSLTGASFAVDSRCIRCFLSGSTTGLTLLAVDYAYVPPTQDSHRTCLARSRRRLIAKVTILGRKRRCFSTDGASPAMSFTRALHALRHPESETPAHDAWRSGQCRAQTGFLSTIIDMPPHEVELELGGFEKHDTRGQARTATTTSTPSAEELRASPDGGQIGITTNGTPNHRASTIDVGLA
ncbi:hypothetical protein B0H13DRAFT_2301036 [Mycena leptocephala]|nr:hypothetical protein B0H13DRAFT_2301036 [Mycena leptocephala]